MPRINLRIYVDPGQAEVFCNVRRLDGSFERFFAIIDTGAQLSLLPDDILSLVEHQLIGTGRIEIEQAGIAKQSFVATEAIVFLMLEDELGNNTKPFAVPVWFANTNKALIGFQGLLDRAVLHIDMPQRTGWLEIDA